MDFSNIFLVLDLAQHHNPFIYNLMLVAGGFFALVFLWALVKSLSGYNNHASSSVFRFAPSVMTALGLLGTFYGLTESLGDLSISNADNISSIEPFINSLKPVFSFSIIGIGSAIIFMLTNALLMAANQKRAKENREQNLDDLQTHRDYSKKVNSATLEQLQKSNNNLITLGSINKLLEQQNGFLNQSYRHRDGKINQQTQALQSIDNTTKTQQSLFANLAKQMSEMTTAINNMQTGFDTEQLASLMGDKIKEALDTPLTNIAKALKENNKTVIEGLLQELKTEVLIPIKEEIAQNTSNINKVTEALQNAQQTNEKMITAINTTTDTINSVVDSNKQAIGSMQGIVDDIQTMQSEQKQTLEQFNKDLKENLSTIEPAIKEGMKNATDDMNGVLETATGKMNDVLDNATDNMNTTLEKTQEALGEIVGEITKNVLARISDILKQFNEDMDSHIGRMNTELEQTGGRAQELMNNSANHLKTTLGEIDSTLQSSSDKLKEELQAFRNQYNLSLTQFFDEQNRQLEQTLGVQNRQLQSTANQLNDQFTAMKEAQETLNRDMRQTINHANSIYAPLLNSATTVASNLNTGQQKMIKDLQAMQEHTDKINDALKKLGNTMPDKFREAFELLNNTYIERFNSTNKMLETAINEMVTAAAALLGTSGLNKDEE